MVRLCCPSRMDMRKHVSQHQPDMVHYMSWLELVKVGPGCSITSNK